MIWGALMKQVLADAPPSEFAVPSGVVFAKTCAETGQVATASCPTTATEVYVSGTEPGEVCTAHGGAAQVDVCLDSGALATDACPPDRVERRTYLSSSGLRLLPDGTISAGESLPTTACPVHSGAHPVEQPGGTPSLREPPSADVGEQT